MKRSGTGRRLSLAGLSAELASLLSSTADRGACDVALNAVLSEVRLILPKQDRFKGFSPFLF